MHHRLVADVAVGEDDGRDSLVVDQLLQLRLRPDGDALRVHGPRQLGRVAPFGDARDLGCGEGDDLDCRVLAEDHVEVMEVASRRAHDQDSPALHFDLPAGVAAADERYDKGRPVPIGGVGSFGPLARAGRSPGGLRQRDRERVGVLGRGPRA
jgi:hypothetical protein